MARRGSESDDGSDYRHLDASGRHTKYTVEQLEILDRAYSECPMANFSRGEELVKQFPVLANVDPKQIKVWFQNRRSRERQRRETTELESCSRSLTATTEILLGEHEQLDEQLSLLVREKDYIQQKRNSGGTVTDIWSYVDVMTTPQHYLRDTNDTAGLLSIAEETLERFLEKATGTAVAWLNMPGTKPTLDSIGIFSISPRTRGVAARACGFVNLDAKGIADFLNDRATWFQDCRSTKICTTVPTNNRGIIEFVYTQIYAPTTLAKARDFWTMRYTTTLEDGSLVVCERSLSGIVAGPDAGMHLEFVRAEMLPSGFVIRPYKGGGSIVYIVDHINFEAQYVPEVLRPIYESPEVVAQRMTFAALRYVRQVAEEASGDAEYASYRQPVILRSYSHKLSRGFNDAINGLSDDGWSQFGSDAAEDVIVTVKSMETGTSSSSYQLPGGILCAKTHMLLENIPPAVLISFLKEQRSEWADFGIDFYWAASLKDSSYPDLMRPTPFSGTQMSSSLGHTIENEQTLEIIRLESAYVGPGDKLVSGEVHFLQMCSGENETSVGAYSELVFSPINDMFANFDFLLPSGFRIIPLIVKSDGTKQNSTHKALGPLSGHGVGLNTRRNDAGNATSSYPERAILTMAFQFPIGNNLVENLASMARQYLRNVIASVHRVTDITPPLESIPGFLSNFPYATPEIDTVALWTWESYCSQVGGNLLRGDGLSDCSIPENLWSHREAILCFSFETRPRFIFANQAGLRMMETTYGTLQDIDVEKIISVSVMNTIRSELPKLIHWGYIWLPGGICTSKRGRLVSYDEVVAWKVLAGDGVTTHCLAISFVNWSFSH